MTRIYTKTGDDGSTGLIGGRRVSKDSLRIRAYGCVDELNAIIGVIRSRRLPRSVAPILLRVQDELFTVGANLAVPAGEDRVRWKIPGLAERNVELLERDIDSCEERLEPLRRFVIPGGTAQGALLHLARTVARRAERSCVSLSRKEKVDPRILRYLNRLSDLLFVLARRVNLEGGKSESHPSFGRGHRRSIP